MARFIKIPNVVFTDSTLPKVESYEDKITAMPDIKGWFRAREDTVMYEPNGEMVWLNDIENGLPCRQASVAMQPTLVENVVQGHASLVWPGDKNANLIWDGQTNIGVDAKTTRIIVLRAALVEGYTSVPFAFASDVAAGNTKRNALYYRYSSNQLEFAVDSPSNYGGGSLVSAGEWVFAICSYDETLNKNSLSINGSESLTLTINEPSTGLSDNLIIGSQSIFGAGAWNGDIAEVMYIEKDLLAAENVNELTLIKNYLYSKFGINP